MAHVGFVEVDQSAQAVFELFVRQLCNVLQVGKTYLVQLEDFRLWQNGAAPFCQYVLQCICEVSRSIVCRGCDLAL